MAKRTSTVVTEEDVYTVTTSGNVAYSEIITPSRNMIHTDGPYFKAEWQTFPEFNPWLRPVPDDKAKAWCQACEKVFKADLKSLRVHGVGRSHARMVQQKFPEAATAVTQPPAVYNVITDRKGTYGLGILSKTESNPTAGSTLYVNPTNPTTNVLTCDPKQDKDNYVIVSMPKRELTDDENQQNDMQDLRELGEIVLDAQSPKKSQVVNANKRSMKRSSSTSKMPKSCDSFTPDDLIETEEEEDEEEEDIDDDDDDDDEDDDDDSMYGFESKLAKLKGSISRKQSAKRNSAGHLSNVPCNAIPIVTESAPFWKAKAIVNGHVSELRLNNYLGRYLILFFYPQDFSTLCAKEIGELSDRISEFRKINTEVVACSVDSYLTHQVWSKMGKAEGGVNNPKIPLLSDYTHQISKLYGCYLPEKGHSSRAHYIIDVKGILRHITISDVHVTRDVGEILKLVQLFQRIDENEKNTLVIEETA